MNCSHRPRKWGRRVLFGTLTLAAAAVLLVGGSGWMPYASAHANKQDKTTTFPSLGDDNIDPNQPLKPDFVINVSVVGEPDPSGNYTIDPAGNVSIKYAGIMTPVAVKGMTPAQAADTIAKMLKVYIKNPQVTVSIITIPRPMVFVAGAVKNSGPTIISADTTLVDILSRAEWTELADLSQVRITHKEKVDGKEKTTVSVVKFDRYVKIAAGEVPDESENPTLHDKDRVFVPFRVAPGVGVVSITGEVTKPAVSVPLRISPAMTIREVINLVGGTTPGANRKSISIRRPTLDRPLIIDLDKAEQGDLVNNIEIRPDDAVYVERLENNAYININGGFVKTGKFVYDKRTTLTQAIMDSGGVAPYSKEKEGKIFRHPDNDPKNTRVISFDWKKIREGKAPDVDLLPGDTVWLTPGRETKEITVFDVLSGLSSLSYFINSISGGTLGGRRF